jgi:hypothetical protein
VPAGTGPPGAGSDVVVFRVVVVVVVGFVVVVVVVVAVVVVVLAGPGGNGTGLPDSRGWQAAKATATTTRPNTVLRLRFCERRGRMETFPSVPASFAGVRSPRVPSHSLARPLWTRRSGTAATLCRSRPRSQSGHGQLTEAVIARLATERDVAQAVLPDSSHNMAVHHGRAATRSNDFTDTAILSAGSPVPIAGKSRGSPDGLR